MSVFLGGETHRRGPFRIARVATVDWIILGIVFLLPAFLVVFSNRSLLGLVIAAVILLVGVALCLPWPWLAVFFGGDSIASWAWAYISYRVRAARGLTRFTPSESVTVPAQIGRVSVSQHEVGDRVVEVIEPFGARDRKGGGYVVGVVEIQGDLHSSLGIPTGERWSNYVASIGGQSSLVSHVTQISRTVAWDSADHEMFVQEKISRQVPSALTASYDQVVDTVRRLAAERRAWLVFRFPLSTGLLHMAGGDLQAREMIAEEITTLARRAGRFGFQTRVLGEKKVAALTRHLLDPSSPADDTSGLADVAGGFREAFPTFVTRDRDALLVRGKDMDWHVSTWGVNAAHVSPQWLPTDFMFPLVTALPGTITRTVAVTTELIDARSARKKAAEDVTSDITELKKQMTEVTSGSEEAQATASSVRKADLAPGGGAVGVNWHMSISFHSPNETVWASDARRMRDALDDCAISAPTLWRYRQDQAIGLWLPLGRAWNKQKDFGGLL